MRTPLACLTALVLPLACRPAAPPDTSTEVRVAIEANNAQWAHYTAAGHADSLVQFYHANAVVMPPNMPPLRGTDAIRAFFGFMNTVSTPPPTLALQADSVWAQGATALEVGRYLFTWPAGATRPPGAPAVDSGKYMVRWVNEGGRWLIVQNIWNSSVAMPLPSQ